MDVKRIFNLQRSIFRPSLQNLSADSLQLVTCDILYKRIRYDTIERNTSY